MLFDWFTFGAQALNFLILVWLLKRFLYKPILHAIEKRERLVAAELANADAAQADADEQLQDFQRKNAEFDRDHDALLHKVAAEAKLEGERLMVLAREAADASSAKRDEAMQRDADALHESLTRRTQDSVFAIARKALSDLAATRLEACVAEVFTRRLAEMSDDSRSRLAHAIDKSVESAVVRSAFEFSAEEQSMLQRSLDETFSTRVRLRFEVAPNVISGIELSCGGQKVGWSIGEYLSSLERDVGDLVHA